MGHKLFQNDNHTIGEFMSAVLDITQHDEAKEFYEEYLAWLKTCSDLSGTPESIAQANIGWCFGEGMKAEHVTMWHEVCGATHPIFGLTTPMPEVALELGIQAGREIIQW